LRNVIKEVIFFSAPPLSKRYIRGLKEAAAPLIAKESMDMWQAKMVSGWS
jgi:hypothetical protein